MHQVNTIGIGGKGFPPVVCFIQQAFEGGKESNAAHGARQDPYRSVNKVGLLFSKLLPLDHLQQGRFAALQ